MKTSKVLPPGKNMHRTCFFSSGEMQKHCVLFLQRRLSETQNPGFFFSWAGDGGTLPARPAVITDIPNS